MSRRFLARGRRGRRGAPLLLLAGILLQAACSQPAPTGRPPDVIVLLIDTLRSDRLGYLGSNRGLSPFIDSLAQRATVFSRAHSASSWTSPSVASLFTSRYPSQHGINAFSSVLDASEQTLAEQLQQGGYVTGGFTANLLINASAGYDQGFDHFHLYYTRPLKERAPHLHRDVLGWLDQTRAAHPEAPVFVYVQYMEAHEPLQPPGEVLRRFAEQRGFDQARTARLAQLARGAPPLERFDEADIPLAEDLYDAEVMSLDDSLRLFFDELDKRGRFDDSLIVVTADHGEEFLDHGAVGHGHTLFEELIHVPLIIKLPRQRDRVDVGDVVSLVDVAPTILEAARVSPPAPFMGQSLLAEMQRSWLWRLLHSVLAASPPHEAYSELGGVATAARPKLHQSSLLSNGGEKLIQLRTGGDESYDLRGDPRERNRDGLSPGRVESLSKAIAGIQKDLTTTHPARTRALDEETRERMRALGYDDHPQQ
jgi:arylsulfatase A-like enzyme